MSFRIAVIADVHLPEVPDTVQQDVLDWALDCLGEEKPDLVVAAGDITALGTRAAAARFCAALDATGLPWTTTPGNAELRSPDEAAAVDELLRGEARVHAPGWTVLLLDTSRLAIPAAEREAFAGRLAAVAAGDALLVVTHVPPDRLRAADRDWLAGVLASRPDAWLVCAHTHQDAVYRLGAVEVQVIRGLDPDKAIGGPPGLSFFEWGCGGRRRRDRLYPGGDIHAWGEDRRRAFLGRLGFSCMQDCLGGLAAASRLRAPVVELRGASLAAADATAVSAATASWRGRGGRHLSVHTRDLRRDPGSGDIIGMAELAADIDRAIRLGGEALTVHVPRTAVGGMTSGSPLWEAFGATMARCLEPAVRSGLTIGIENLHLAPGEADDARRPFGCAPAECLAWIGDLRERLPGGAKIGLHLDIGHARNNGWLASKYSLGSWYALVGAEVTGYHLHQVAANAEGRVGNHMPFTGLYGPYISLVSFFRAWEMEQLRHAPMILEIRAPHNGADTLEFLRRTFEI